MWTEWRPWYGRDRISIPFVASVSTDRFFGEGVEDDCGLKRFDCYFMLIGKSVVGELEHEEKPRK